MAESQSVGMTESALRLSCRNVWKIYRGRPEVYFTAGAEPDDPRALAARMRGEGVIPAAVTRYPDATGGRGSALRPSTAGHGETHARWQSRPPAGSAPHSLV